MLGGILERREFHKGEKKASCLQTRDYSFEQTGKGPGGGAEIWTRGSLTIESESSVFKRHML